MSGRKTDSWFLGIDLGTGSCKTVVVNEQTQVLGFGSCEYAASTHYQKWQEQDPSAVLNGMVRSVQIAIDQAGELRGTCSRISIGGALHSLMALDDSGNPLTGIMTWATGRAVHEAESLRRTPHAQDLYRQTGCPVHGMYPLYKALWLRRDRPEIFKRAAHFLSAKEYVFAQLTGQHVVDYCLAAGSGFLNIHDLAWNNLSLELAEIDATQLSSPCGPGEVFRVTNTELAAGMGIPPNTHIVLGSADAVNSSLGAGGVFPWQATCMIGTSGALRIISDQPILDAASRTWCYAIDRGHWLVGGAVNNGGIALSWLLNLLHSALPNLPSELQISFDDLTALASRSRIGAEGLICLPFFAGERSPNWNLQAKAMFIGLALHHNMEHVARAVLEGISFRFRSVYDVLTEVAVDIRQIRASGGFTHSPFWVQVVSDVVQKELVVPSWGETSSLGSALWAIGGAETLSSFDHIQELITVRSVHRPDPRNMEIYEKLYGLYTDLYAALSPFFVRISKFQEDNC